MRMDAEHVSPNPVGGGDEASRHEGMLSGECFVGDHAEQHIGAPVGRLENI